MNVSEEVIAAGAKAMDAYWGGRYAPYEVEELRGEITAIVKAVSPLLVAKALDDAADEFEGLPVNKGAEISSGTWDWFDLFPIQHIRARAEKIRGGE